VYVSRGLPSTGFAFDRPLQSGSDSISRNEGELNLAAGNCIRECRCKTAMKRSAAVQNLVGLKTHWDSPAKAFRLNLMKAISSIKLHWASARSDGYFKFGTWQDGIYCDYREFGCSF
jgi:hypothetical protein